VTRAEAIRAIISRLADRDVALFTTGMISREAYSLGDREGNFYMLGSMGLLSAFGLGIALNNPARRVVIVEGDGSALMSLGNFALIGSQQPRNLCHIVIDNEAYESTGGQPTVTSDVDLAQVASASGYASAGKVDNLDDLVKILPELVNSDGPAFLLVKVELVGKEVPGRVALSPIEIKQRLGGFLEHGI